LPEPVGAASKVCSARAIAGHDAVCTGVGSEKCLSNQALTAGWKVSNATRVPVRVSGHYSTGCTNVQYAGHTAQIRIDRTPGSA